MQRLTDQIHDILREHIHPGDTAIDATLGTGQDARFLAQQVGETGCVLAFDIQPEAIRLARYRFEQEAITNVKCIEDCHSNLGRHLADHSQKQVAALVFNLGYLPGGDKRIVTRTETTVAAIKSGFDTLRVGGIISVLAYIGHPGGNEEAQNVEATLATMSSGSWIRRDPEIEGSRTPRALVLQKSDRSM